MPSQSSLGGLEEEAEAAPETQATASVVEAPRAARLGVAILLGDAEVLRDRGAFGETDELGDLLDAGRRFGGEAVELLGESDSSNGSLANALMTASHRSSRSMINRRSKLAPLFSLQLVFAVAPMKRSAAISRMAARRHRSSARKSQSSRVPYRFARAHRFEEAHDS